MTGTRQHQEQPHDAADLERIASEQTLPLDAAIEVVQIKAFRLRWGHWSTRLLPWVNDDVHLSEPDAERAARALMRSHAQASALES